MLIQQALHFRRPHLEAGGIDHALQPIDQEEVAVLVRAREIAGAEEALAVGLDERFRRRFRIFPVADQHLRPVHDDLADLSGGQLAEGFRIDHARVDVENRYAEALLLRPLRRIDVAGRHRFREPIALDELDIELVLQPLGDGLGHGRAPAAQAFETLEVVV